MGPGRLPARRPALAGLGEWWMYRCPRAPVSTLNDEDASVFLSGLSDRSAAADTGSDVRVRAHGMRRHVGDLSGCLVSEAGSALDGGGGEAGHHRGETDAGADVVERGIARSERPGDVFSGAVDPRQEGNMLGGPGTGRETAVVDSAGKFTVFLRHRSASRRYIAACSVNSCRPVSAVRRSVNAARSSRRRATAIRTAEGVKPAPYASVSSRSRSSRRPWRAGSNPAASSAYGTSR